MNTDQKAIEEKNCKECLHFEACCKWTDFPRQIGFPICRKFKPVESYRKQSEPISCGHEKGYRKQSENTVEVVRCKDCLHYQNGGCNHFGYHTYSPDVDEDDFCSYGEPKMKGGKV